MCLRVSYKEKIWEKIFFFASLQSLKKRVGSGFMSQSARPTYCTVHYISHRFLAGAVATLAYSVFCVIFYFQKILFSTIFIYS